MITRRSRNGKLLTFRDQFVNLRQISVFLRIVQPIADDEDVIDFSAQVGDVDIYFPPGGFGQEADDSNGSGVARPDHGSHVIQGDTRVDDILDQVNIPVPDVGCDVLDQDYGT